MKKYSLFFLLFFTMHTMAQSFTDYHAHYVVPSYLELLKEHNALLDEGFPIPQWTMEGHLQLMDEVGIDQTILTLPAPHPYFGNQEECNVACRQFNEQAAEICKTHPNRFKFCATLPLPDVSSAIREAIYALDTLGAVGVKLATNVYGQYLGDSILDPLIQFLSERKALVILHPHKPTPTNGAVMKQTPLAMQEYLSETTRAVTNMISRNVLARYPNMRVVVPHSGAYLPIAIPRMQSLYPVMHRNGLMGEIDFEKNIQCLYFDLAGSPSEATVQALLSLTTPDHLLYGTDYPYVAPQVIKANVERMKSHLPMRVEEKSAGDFIVRIAEIAVHKRYWKEYLQAAHKVAAESLKKEAGVICLFPMEIPEQPYTVRIVEIYKDTVAYQAHLQTEHFKEYKQGTLHMVKELKLVDTQPLAKEMMPQIYRKL